MDFHAGEPFSCLLDLHLRPPFSLFSPKGTISLVKNTLTSQFTSDTSKYKYLF